MKPRLISLAAAAAVVTAAALAPAAQAATSIVISQVAFGGPGGGNDEVVEIRNVSGAAVNIGGFELAGSNSAGTVSVRATVPAGTSLPAGKTYVFANSAGSFTAQADVLYGTGIANTGGAAIRNGGTIMDAFGSTAVPLPYREGLGIAQPSSGAGGFIRKGGGTQDTDLNEADFDGPTTPVPTKCGTDCPVVAPPGPCSPGTDGLTPITKIQTLGDGASCNGTRVTIRGTVTGIDDLYGSNFTSIFKADSGIWIQNPTREAGATTSSALFIAAIARDPLNPAAVIGSDITISGRVETKFGQVGIVPDGVGSTGSPLTNEVPLTSVATIHSTGNPLPAPVVLDKAAAEGQGKPRAYYRSLQGMRVQLLEGIATGGGTTKFRDVFVEPGTNARRLFRKDDDDAVSTPWYDAPAELGIAPDGGARNPKDPRLPWFSETQVNLDLFDVVRNVVGPLSFGFSYYKIMPQLNGPTPAIERGPINAAYPPAVPDPDEDKTLRVASFNVENLFPVGKENDGHVVTAEEYKARVDAIVLAVRNFLKEPDVIAVQEVAVFADGANALPGLAQALGNYTPYIATNNDGRGIAPGFLIKAGTTASNGEVIGADRPSPWGSSAVCDLHPGPLFDRAPYKLEIKKGDLSLVALSNHWASQSHENACRIKEAEYVRQEALKFQQAGRNVLVAGDLNDFEFSDSLAELGAGGTLRNLWTEAPAGQAYSYKFNGHLQTLDHIFVTAGLESRVKDFRYVHFDNDYYERHPTDGTGISDHDPPVATFELVPTSTSVTGDLTGSVPATLALSIGNASFGAFTPGIARTYDASMPATVTSTGADATLSVIDASSTATGRLVNGTHTLRSPVQVSANGAAFTPLRTDNGPLTLASWNEPISARSVAVAFKQSIAEDEGLRTGAYAKTLTFTLSTTNP